MSGPDEQFDPYYKWLGIAPAQQPPHHYRLLGINLFEQDPDVISAAADRQMAHVRTFQTGKHAQASQRLLNELAAARVCLLDPQKKLAYDAELRARLLRGQDQREERKKERESGPAPTFAFYVQGARRYVAVLVRRFWITFTRLPGAYWNLGVDVYQQGRYRDRLESLYRKLDAVSQQMAAPKPGAPAAAPPPGAPQPAGEGKQGYWGRVKAGFRAVLLDRKRTSLLRALGKAVYELDPSQCGPPHLIEPLQQELSRLANLRKEAAELAEVPPGQAVSPRHVAWIALGAAAMVLLLLAMILGR